MNGPLTGIRAVEFAAYIAGPGVGAILADLGADVIKVEPPTGDATRTNGPFGEAIWCNFNRGKRSVVLDMRLDTGRRAALDLVDGSDVVIQNLRPGGIERLGLGPAEVLARNPKVIYLSVTGFGRDGPNRLRPGFDVAVQAESGMMSLTGELDGDPLRIGYPAVDVVCSHIGAEAVLGALLGRHRTGQGTSISISMFEVAVHLQNIPLSTYFAQGSQPPRSGNGQPYNAPAAEMIDTADGQIVLSAYTEPHWRRLCEAIGRPDLITDNRFTTNALRVAHRAEMLVELRAALSHLDSASAVALLSEHSIVSGVVRDYDGLIRCAEFTHGEFVIDSSMADGSTFHSIRPPYHLGDGSDDATLPVLGADTAAVLAEFGWSEQQIDELLSEHGTAVAPGRGAHVPDSPIES